MSSKKLWLTGQVQLRQSHEFGFGLAQVGSMHEEYYRVPCPWALAL
jgi:hypothetical protein